jgi:hypothetical protein
MFYTTGVDIANTKSMWEFLHNHFQYYTMNSWNRSKSIAHNVKLYNLALEGDWTVAMRYLFDEADAGLLQMYIDDEIQEFERQYPYYKVYSNGRSGGYLVLCNADNNCSVLPDCLDYDCYDDFKTEARWDGYRVSDFDRELREAVEIVREFDKLCDRLRDLVNEYSKKSFDVDKLENAVERFENEYYSDLEKLELEGPCMEGDRVRLNDIADYNAFMECFVRCFGEDYNRITTDSEDKYLWLKEN